MTSQTPQQFEGQEAVDFAERHLRKLKVDPQTWQIDYEDPKTGDKWVMDYPHSEEHGGGSPRLRKAPLMEIRLQPSETILTGQWICQGGKVVGDDVTDRIHALIRSHLVEIGRDASGWDALYQDPDDGRYWEHTYPQSHMHGGGPPQLRYLTTDEAKQKYSLP